MIYGDDEFAIKCLLLLYDEQEADEQDTQLTQHENSAGFNKSDSVFLSQCAEQAKEGKLSGDDLLQVKKRLQKYANQLSYLLPADEF